MDDIAAAAGVSRATVSRALSGEGFVSSETMLAIQRAVRQTGYVVNEHARSLARQRSQTVAFMLCEPQQRLAEDPALSALLSACTQALAAHRLGLSLLICDDQTRRAEICQQVTGGQVAGALVVSTCTGGPLIRELQAVGVPMVAYGAPACRELEVAYVASDDRSGARQMVRYLRETGRRTIATIAGPPHTPSGAQRLAGWQDLLGATASEPLVAIGDYTCAGGRAAMASLLEQAPTLDAVLVASDLMAAGAITTLRKSGRRVPDDIAVAGFGDSAVATTVEPALTTVRQPVARVGAEMVRLLRDLIDGAPPVGVVLPTELVIRDSA